MSVAVDAMLSIQTRDAVTLADDSNFVSLNLIGGTSTRIGIFGASVGDGEVEVTANGIGAGTGAEQEILTVSVMVSTPTLVITGVPANINLLTREETEFIVSVRAEAGEPGNVALTAVIDDENVAEVRLRTINVEAGTMMATVTVTGFNVAGNTTLTLTAKHSDYETEIIKVPVNVSLRPLELIVVSSPLVIVTGMSEELTIGVSADPAVTEDVTLKVAVNDEDRIEGLADEYVLIGETSTEITVTGGSIGMTTLRIEAAADGYTTTRASVSVEVLEVLSLVVTPARFNLAEGVSSPLSVGVNRLGAGAGADEVEVEIMLEGSGLEVTRSSLSVTDAVAPAVTVTATEDTDYTGNRDATLTFTATGYTTATVTIRIIDNEDPPIELSVMPSPLVIVTGERAELMLTVTPTAMITIISDNDNIASVAESAAAFELEGGANNSARINVSGGNVGNTTLTIEASMTGYTTETATVDVDVLESLRIVATPVSVVLVAGGASTQINVSVSRVVGESVRVDIDASVGLRVPSSVTLTNLDAIEVEVTALAGASGTATVTFTASDYAMATVTVRVAPPPLLPTIGLVVEPDALEIVTGESAELTITATPTAMITISSGDAGIAFVADAEFELQEGVETTIDVFGGNVDTTTLTITAAAEGYTDTTVSVAVNVLESLRIAATPVSVVLVAGGDSTQINVSVSRVVGESVRVDIDATAGLSVASSVTLTNLDAIEVEVTALAGASGTATVTFTASDYAMAMVTVRVAPPPLLPTIGLVVEPDALEIVTGESAELTITATPTAMITISSGDAGIAFVADAEFELQEGVETTIDVFGGNVDTTTLTITAAADGYTDTTVSVAVNVLESLRIAATPVSVVLVAGGDSTQINVSVSRVVGESVRVDIDATAGLSVASSVTLTNLDAIEVEVTALAGASGTATVTFTASDYAMATVTVRVAPPPLLPTIGLVVEPDALEIVTGESAELTITATPTAMITISSGDAGIAFVADAEFELQEGVETTIDVFGGNVDTTTLTITAAADGYTATTVSVAVNVLESLRIAATPVSVVLVAGGDSTQINVSVSRVVGESVRVDIDATAGLSVASSVTLENLDAIEVEVTALAGASGTATVTFTATDYAMATVAVEIEAAPTQPELAVGLEVEPRVLEIVTEESTQISIMVLMVSTTATITITGDPEGIAEASTTSFSLGNTESRTINVRGAKSGDTTLTITAAAAGHTDTTVSVAVNVLESLRIAATPVSVVLVAGGDSTQINVSVSRVVGESVRVDIDATNGLSVAQSVTLTNLDAIEVEVTALAGASGTATVTFTASDYAMATVTVRVAPPPLLPTIGLVVEPDALEIVTGESAELTITATPTAMITISSGDAGIAFVADAEFELQEGVETTIDVFGGNVDTTTLTITAAADGYTDTTVSVAVNVLESLRIAATPVSVVLVAGW